MEWDTETRMHVSIPGVRIITVGGFGIEAVSLREFWEVRAPRSNKGCQVLYCARHRKISANAVGRVEGRKGAWKLASEMGQEEEERSAVGGGG